MHNCHLGLVKQMSISQIHVCYPELFGAQFAVIKELFMERLINYVHLRALDSRAENMAFAGFQCKQRVSHYIPDQLRTSIQHHGYFNPIQEV